MNDGKIQNLSRGRTPCLGDAAESLFPRRVVTTGRQTEIIRQTVGILESLDVADP